MGTSLAQQAGLNSQSTLVDVVGKVFSGVDTAISKVKDVAHQALNAIKDGLEFIANAVLGPFLNGIAFILQSLSKVLVEIVQVLNPNINVQTLSDGISIDDFTFRIYRDGLNLVISFNNLKFSIQTAYLIPYVKSETLSAGEVMKTAQLTGFASLLTGVIATANFVRSKSIMSKSIGQIGVGIFSTAFILQFLDALSIVLNPNEDAQSYLQEMITFYIYSGFGFLFSIAMDHFLNPTSLADGILMAMAEAMFGASLPFLLNLKDDTQTMIGFYMGITYAILSTVIGGISSTTVIPWASNLTNIILAIYSFSTAAALYGILQRL